MKRGNRERDATLHKVELKKLAAALPYTEAQLLVGLDPVTAHADLVAEPLTFPLREKS